MLLCFSYHQSNLQLIYRHIASSLEKQHLIFNALFTLKCHSKWLCEPTLLIPLRQGPKWHRMLSGCSCQVNIFSCLDAFFSPAALKLRLKPAVLVLHCIMHVSLCPHICLPVYPLFPCIEQHIVRYYLAYMWIYIQINISVYFFFLLHCLRTNF